MSLPLAAGRSFLLAGPSPAPSPAAPGAPLPPATDVVTNFDKAWRPLPSQGYDERSKAKWVEHEDMDTMVGDWHAERPRQQGETQEGDSTLRACMEHPEHLWCKLYLKRHARQGGIVHEVRKVVKGGRKAGQRAIEAAARDQSQAVARDVAKAQTGLHKAGDATAEQAEDAADDVSRALPPGMAPTEDDLEKQQDSVRAEGDEHGGDYPPGMLSKKGGKSPHASVAFGAEPSHALPSGSHGRVNMTTLW